MKKLLVIVSLLVTALAARAQVVFTVTGVAQNTAAGYNLGDSYTFVFTVTSNFISGSGNTSLGPGGNIWNEQSTPADSPLFNAITGAVTGTFGLPTSTPNSSITVQEEGNFTLYAGANDEGGSIMGATGLKTLSGEDTHIEANIRFASSTIRNALIASLSSGSSQPAAFFLPHAGSYATSGGYYLNLFSPDTAPQNSFEITNVTISASAIPEPSTYAALAGAVVLGCAFLRRRQKRA